ncbi:MAG TPA: PfkB family carbohydrate kinase [Acidimicrobiales bacterium]|nr:PfkB family carbohydrate kinase [Acidimicrobiales bacterium]
MTGRLTVAGDVLVDRDVVGGVRRVAPDAPVPVVDVASRTTRPGGAGLAALLAAADGRPVTLVTALGSDAAGAEVAALLEDAGVDVVDLGLAGPTPEKVRAGTPGHPMLRLDYGGPPSPVGPLTPAARRALGGAAAVLVADYGRGVAAHPEVRAALAALPARRPVVWDPHPRGPAPVAGARLATPNREEAGVPPGAGLAAVTARARALAEQWSAVGVAVTLGSRGAVLVEGDGPPLAVPARPAAGDPCGAGDRFASRAAGLLADGALPSEAVTGAVAAAAAFVASGGAGGALPSDPPAPRAGGDGGVVDALALVDGVRAAGGTVVAAGGCFDLLHAGHVGLLEAARRLGDCLVVCLNSDDSVRRLKGPGRPVQSAADRARVVLALGCVDAVAVFDEDTPEAVLARLRPHVFAKGGDYAGGRLPEAALLAGWGGQAAVLPYLEGRSTTRLIEEANAHARG